MLKKILCVFCMVFMSLLICQAQSVYMHEAQEDVMEQEKEGGLFTGIVGLLLFFGIVYVVGNMWDSHKESLKQREEYKQKKTVSDNIANENLVKDVNISKYQHKQAWQKGYKQATYDTLYKTPRKLVGKTIDDLIAEYRHTCELGHIVQANKIMEEIGYFQSLEQQNDN